MWWHKKIVAKFSSTTNIRFGDPSTDKYSEYWYSDDSGGYEGLDCGSERVEARGPGWKPAPFIAINYDQISNIWKLSSMNYDQILDVNGESFQHVMTLERAVEILTKQTLLQVNKQTK